MKTLFLIRHAKSSWDNPEWTDFSRPLNDRGFRDAELMAEIFARKVKSLDAIIASPAMRAITTTHIFTKYLNFDKNDIILDENIYEARASYIKQLVLGTNDCIESLAIFGHNPSMTSLSSYFLGDYVDNLPTCSIVCIDFDIDSWKKIEDINGILRFFDYPKLYKNNSK